MKDEQKRRDEEQERVTDRQSNEQVKIHHLFYFFFFLKREKFTSSNQISLRIPTKVMDVVEIPARMWSNSSRDAVVLQIKSTSTSTMSKSMKIP
jgi:hypothetical protein